MTLSSFARLLMLCKDTSDTQPAATMTAIWDSALAQKPTQALILDTSMTVTKEQAIMAISGIRVAAMGPTQVNSQKCVMKPGGSIWQPKYWVLRDTIFMIGIS